MKTYYVAELLNRGSYRKAEKIKAKNLTSAKRTASRNQLYQGTTLVIFFGIDDDGFGEGELCRKETGYGKSNKWSDTYDY